MHEDNVQKGLVICRGGPLVVALSWLKLDALGIAGLAESGGCVDVAYLPPYTLECDELQLACPIVRALKWCFEPPPSAAAPLQWWPNPPFG